MDVHSILQQQLLIKQVDVFNLQQFKKRKPNWVCALGKHQEIWDYLIFGSLENCLDLTWSSLEHQVRLPKNQFKSQLKKNNGYIGQFAEIKKLPKKIQLGSGLAIGNSMIIFDHPEEINVGLSKSIYASLFPNFTGIIFGHKVLQGLSRKKINNQLANWSNLNFLGEKYHPKNGLESVESLSISNYPLIITNSPFILAKVYGEGLIGCFVPSLMTLVYSDKKREQEGILRELYNWLAPHPKNIYLIEEKLKIFCQEGYYTETEEYYNNWLNIRQEIDYQAQKLGSQVTYMLVNKKIKASKIVEMIKEQEALFE